MTLLKTSFLNGIAVIIKMLTLLGINKVLAIYVGPSGYAALGQFQNALQIISTFASGSVNTGVTKYTAEYIDDIDKQHAVWKTAGTLATCASLVTALVIAIFSKSLANIFFNDKALYTVFLWLAGGLVFLTLNSLVLAILNGKKDIFRFVAANIIGSIFALFTTSILAVKFGLYGALVALALYQSLSFFVTIFICRKVVWFKLSFLFGSVDIKIAKNLLKFTAMALTSAACVPLSQIYIRNYLGDTFSWEAAGYWEAMTRLSSAYLLLITSTLSVYYLPRLAELKLVQKIKSEIAQGYLYILPCTIIMGLLIYIMRDFIIGVLFTQEFNPMRELFAWQMVGDSLKIGSWILAYLMLSKAMYKVFIVTEVIFSITFVALTMLFCHVFGFVGVTIAYAFNYTIYWLVMVCVIYYKFRVAMNTKEGVLC